jgi:chromosome segregation ATPase
VEPEPRPQPEPPAVARLFGRRRHAHTPAAELTHLRESIAAEREARHAAESTAVEERARAQRAEALLAEELRSTVGKTEELIDRIGGYEHSRVSFEEELAAVRRTHADLLAEAREEHALELAGLREELDSARRELASALEDLDAMNEHVDTLHEAHSLELGAARSQRDAADEALASTEQRLTESTAEAEALRTHLEERESLIERARADAAQGAEESADLHAAMVRLRDAIAIRARDAAMARRRFSRSPEALNRSRDELRRDADRIAALERQAEALRDAIHSQLPYSLHASPLQEALPLGEETEVQSEA